MITGCTVTKHYHPSFCCSIFDLFFLKQLLLVVKLGLSHHFPELMTRNIVKRFCS